MLCGSGSAQKFRDNFIARLAEAYGNLAWLIDCRLGDPQYFEQHFKEVDQLELDFFLQLKPEIEKLGYELPDWFYNSYKRLETAIKKKSGTPTSV